MQHNHEEAQWHANVSEAPETSETSETSEAPETSEASETSDRHLHPPEEALQAITDHVHTRFTKQDPTLFQNWTQLMPILADEVQELIDALHSKDAQAIVDEAGDVLYVSCYGLRFTTEMEGEIAAISKPIPWSQMHHFSPTSDEMTNFIDNVTRLQRLTSGGAELTELWFEAQSLGAQWCAMTGDISTPTIDIDAVLFGPPWYSQTPSRIQLRHGLQSLLECICLNSTKDAIHVHQARRALGHCLLEAQHLAYPTDQAANHNSQEEGRKRKLKKIRDTPVAAPLSQNSAPGPEIEQPAKTAASAKTAAPDTACNHTELPQASMSVAALLSQNSAPVPEI